MTEPESRGSPSFSREEIEKASHWVARHERGLTKEEAEAFKRWLSAKPSHQDCFFEHQIAWASFDVMDEWKPAFTNPPNPDLFGKWPSSRWKGFLTLGGLAAVVSIGIWIGLKGPEESKRSPSSDGTVYASSSHEKHFLEDGSSFYLLPESKVIVSYSEEERRIEFVAGEAFFSVAHDPKRPFVVQSDMGRVVALGTAFSVKQDATLWEVFVTEGKVKVDDFIAESLDDSDTGSSYSAELVAGQKIVQAFSGDRSIPRIEIYSASEMERKLKWKNQIIDMVSAPLDEILNEFKRSGDREVIIVDESLKNLRMTVAIRADNLKDFLDLLQLTENVKVMNASNGTIELSQSVQ